MLSTFAIGFAFGCSTATGEAEGSSNAAETAAAPRKDGLLGVDAAIKLQNFAPSAAPNPTAAALADLGVRRVRVEMLPGDAAEAELTAAIADLAKVHIKVNLQIDYVTVPGFEDALAAGKWADYSKRFSAEASRLAAKFGAHVNTIQIWNEQDFDWYVAEMDVNLKVLHPAQCMPRGKYRPCLEPKDYAELLAGACSAIHAASATVPVITGGFASPRANRWPYVEAVFANPGVKSCVKGIGYHVYASVTKAGSSQFVCDPADKSCHVIELEHDLVGLHEHSGTKLPITIDEWGVFTEQLDNGANAAERADILARNVTGFFDLVTKPAVKDIVAEATYYAYDDGGENKMSMSTRPAVLAAFRQAACPAKATRGCTK